MSAKIIVITLGALLTAPAPAADSGHRRHSAHEHGAARLNVALDGDTLHLEFISPAANIVGFEHPPGTDAQRRRLAEAVATLEEGSRMFLPTPAAGCALGEATVTSELLDDEPDDHAREGHAHLEGEEIHSEFHVRYRFRCDNPPALEHLEVRVFELFPGTETLEVQVVGPRGQGVHTLEAGAARLPL